MSKYPRIGVSTPRKKNTQAKCRCGEVGQYKVEIQWDYFRGNDDVIWACNDHRKSLEYLTLNQ